MDRIIEIENEDSNLDRMMIKGFDHDKEFKRLYKDILTKKIPDKEPAYQQFTNTGGALFCDLDKIMPVFPNDPTDFEYFITCAFPDNHNFNMKYLEITAQSSKYKIGPKRYRECTPDEQYNFILRTLQKHILLIATRYHIFFEQHKSGDLHIHGRIVTPDKMNMKTLKTFIHRMFDCPMNFKRFCDIKPYEHKKWKEYHDKEGKPKEYQKTGYPVFKNIKYIE